MLLTTSRRNRLEIVLACLLMGSFLVIVMISVSGVLSLPRVEEQRVPCPGGGSDCRHTTAMALQLKEPSDKAIQRLGHHQPIKQRLRSLVQQSPPDRNPNHRNRTKCLEIFDAANADDQKFILFLPPFGQGMGNIMHGLLGAHVLGEEFNRTVCVSPSVPVADFQQAFAPVDATCQAVHEHCEREDIKLLSVKRVQAKLHILNYQSDKTDECKIQDTLQSPTQIVWMTSNTYPGWTAVPTERGTGNEPLYGYSERGRTVTDVVPYFARHYRPRPDLVRYLPQPPPQTVVHLRMPDEVGDHRDGLDTTTLQLLGQSMPTGGNTYLITNQVAWYQEKARKYGWSYPKYRVNGPPIVHSAKKMQRWGMARSYQNNTATAAERHLIDWADWYTILLANQVYHIHSDYSASAVHWKYHQEPVHPVEGHVVTGSNGTHIISYAESWLRDQAQRPVPLKQRKRNAVNELEQLNQCRDY